MKKLIAVLLIAVLTAALLCACGKSDEELSEARKDYPGTYLYENNTIRERSSRTLTISEDGTYLYVRVSTLPGKDGTFSGTWTIDSEGYILLKAESGQISKGLLSEDRMLLDVSDLSGGEDTVGDGIYRYQIPQDPATPDAG